MGLINAFASGTVEPIDGFHAPSLAEASEQFGDLMLPLSLFSPGDVSDLAPKANAIASNSCTILCTTDQPYLQCTLYFGCAEGSLEIYHGGRMIDRADLFRGWQHSAVDVSGAQAGEPLTLRFCDHAGEDVSGIVIESLSLSDTWGRGQRRRLKCSFPFTFAAIGTDFDVYPCCARQWLRGNPCAGNVRTDDLTTIWNAPAYVEMRQNFLDGDYASSCREEICPYLRSESVPVEHSEPVIQAINDGITILDFGPSNLHHDIDRGCNLACNMCRDVKILPDQSNVDQAVRDINSALGMGALSEISFSGAGEIFIMAKIVRLIESEAFSSQNVGINITTNLTYFDQKLWDRIKHNRFNSVFVSADGATRETYESIRIGANWDRFQTNVQFLATLRRSGAIKFLMWSFTVQRANIADVVPAIALAKAQGFDQIRLIGQLGSLAGTNGNMFEDFDLAALDQLHDELSQIDAFNDPFVALVELGIADREYRNFANQLSTAQHIYDRESWNLTVGPHKISRSVPKKCLSILEQLMRDVKIGNTTTPEQLATHNIAFISTLLQRNAPRVPHHIYRLFPNRWRQKHHHHMSRELAHWLRGLIATSDAVEPMIAAN